MKGRHAGCPIPSSWPVCAAPRWAHLLSLGGHWALQVLLLQMRSRCCSFLQAPTCQLQPNCILDECFRFARSVVVPYMPALVHLYWMGGESRCGVACFLSDYLAIQWATRFSHELWIPGLGRKPVLLVWFFLQCSISSLKYSSSSLYPFIFIPQL